MKKAESIRRPSLECRAARRFVLHRYGLPNGLRARRTRSRRQVCLILGIFWIKRNDILDGADFGDWGNAQTRLGGFNMRRIPKIMQRHDSRGEKHEHHDDDG